MQKLKEWATFSIYLPGAEGDKKVLVKFTRSAWVVDDLAPNLLLGNDFLIPYRANIDYDAKIVTLRAINLVVPFSVRTHSMLCVRRVRTTRAITLCPDQEAMVEVDCKPLSKGPAEGSEDFFRPGLPFVLSQGLLYNFRPHGLQSVYIPHKMVKTILSMVHDQKHHFSVDRMLYDLRGVSMVNKTYLVKKFAQHRPQCNVVSADRQPPIGSLQPIRPADSLPMRVIAIDFIVGLPTVLSEAANPTSGRRSTSYGIHRAYCRNTGNARAAGLSHLPTRRPRCRPRRHRPFERQRPLLRHRKRRIKSRQR